MKKRLIFILSLISSGLALTVALLLITLPSFAPQRGDALVQGNIEEGYEFVGYIISDKNKVCAASLIDESTIVTAAHCLANNSGDNFYFGLGEFTTDLSNLTKIVAVNFPSNFNKVDAIGPDFAVANLNNPIRLNNYAEIGSPIQDCNATIVAYGAGISSSATEELFQKKSGSGCVSSISDSFVVSFNPEVGICFGDSGGPIFLENGSNILVGVLSGGVINSRLDKLECETSNYGYAITAENYTNLIETTQNFERVSNSVTFSPINSEIDFNTNNILMNADNSTLSNFDDTTAQLSGIVRFSNIAFYTIIGMISLFSLMIIIIIVRL